MHEQPSLKRYTGEFLDKVMEGRYKRSTHTRNLQHLRISLIVVAVLILTFGAVDYYMMGSTSNFYLLLGMRGIVALGCVTLTASLGRDPGLLYSTQPLNLVCFLLVTS